MMLRRLVSCQSSFDHSAWPVIDTVVHSSRRDIEKDLSYLAGSPIKTPMMGRNFIVAEYNGKIGLIKVYGSQEGILLPIKQRRSGWGGRSISKVTLEALSPFLFLFLWLLVERWPLRNDPAREIPRVLCYMTTGGDRSLRQRRVNDRSPSLLYS